MNSTAISAAGFAASPSPRILVVGHSPGCLKIFATVLTMSGYRVTTAVDGVEALHRIFAETFDLVLSDWKMPILNGGSLILAMRTKRIATPAIILSGDFAESPLPTGVTQEVFAALEIPIDPPVLIATVAAALRGQSHAKLCVA